MEVVKHIDPPEANQRGKAVVLCPFHREHTPSCMIDYQRMLWVCLGCGLGGSLDYHEHEGKRVLSLLGTALIEGIPERSKAKVRDEHAPW